MLRFRLSVGSLALLIPLHCVHSSEDGRAAEEGADKVCEAIIDRFAQAFAQAKMIEFEVALHQQRIEKDREFSPPPIRYRISLAEGGLLRIEPVDVSPLDLMSVSVQSVTVISDGKNVFYFDSVSNRYLIEPALDTWKELLQDLSVSSFFGLQQVVFHLMPVLPDNGLIEVVPSDVGVHEEGGRVFRQCRLQIDGAQEKDDRYAWYEEGDPPVPRRLDRSREVTDWSAGHDVNVLFDAWRLSPIIESERFAIQIPKDGEKVRSHRMLRAPRLPGLADPVDLPESLLDGPAPNFRLETREGTTIALNDLRGKQIVVLGFWTTSSGPAVRTLPELMAIENEFADRDVVFIAINRGQAPLRVEEFLRQQGLDDLNVAFDRHGRAAARYRVRGLTHTFIIDRDGIIRSLHTDPSPNFRQRIRRAIEVVLADEGDRERKD